MNANSQQKTVAAQKFIGWVRRFHPEMHAAIVSRAGEAPKSGALNQLGEAWDMFYPSLYYKGTGYRGRWHGNEQQLGQVDPWGGIGVSSTTTTTVEDNGAWYSEVFKFAKEAVPAYLAYDAQKDIMNMNIERAKQGLPPIDPGVVAPQVRVVHDFPPVVQEEIRSWKDSALKIGIWAALGLAAFFVVRRVL